MTLASWMISSYWNLVYNSEYTQISFQNCWRVGKISNLKWKVHKHPIVSIEPPKKSPASQLNRVNEACEKPISFLISLRKVPPHFPSWHPQQLNFHSQKLIYSQFESHTNNLHFKKSSKSELSVKSYWISTRKTQNFPLCATLGDSSFLLWNL